MGTMLRKLESRDVTGMLEWIHDERVAENFRFDFMSMTKEKALDFISHSFTDENQHFAIVDAQNNYVGTISLKKYFANRQQCRICHSFAPRILGQGLRAEGDGGNFGIRF